MAQPYDSLSLALRHAEERMQKLKKRGKMHAIYDTIETALLVAVSNPGEFQRIHQGGGRIAERVCETCSGNLKERTG